MKKVWQGLGELVRTYAKRGFDRCGAVVWFLFSSLICCTFSPGHAENSVIAAEPISRTSLLAEQPFVPDLSWNEVVGDEKWRIVTLIADHLRDNYAKIETWKGTCRVRSICAQKEAFLKAHFKSKIGDRDLSNVVADTAYDLDFAMNLRDQRIYRAKTTDVFYWRDQNNDEQFKIMNTSQIDERSYATSDEFVHFDPLMMWPEFNYVRNHPDGKNKRAAFREIPEEGRKKHFGDLLDPRVFYGHDQDERLWEMLEYCFDAHLGKFGDEKKQKIELAVHVFEADEPGGKVFRYEYNMEPSGARAGDPMIYSSWVFQGNIGFHPTSFFMRQADRNENLREMKWRWTNLEGVYVPAVVLEVQKQPQTRPYELEFWRESELQSCKINEPLSDDQFSLKGLGLKEGELVVDNIGRSVGMLKGNKIEQLGDFGTQYVEPPKRSGISLIRFLFLGVNLVLLVGAVYWSVGRRKALV